MNSGLIIVSISLSGLVCASCILLYTKLRTLIESINAQTIKITELEKVLSEIVDIQVSTQHCIKELGTEIRLREVYQSADDRHQVAIKDAKEGKNHVELVRLHGLSSDEAALLVALHGNNVMGSRLESSDRYRADA